MQCKGSEFFFIIFYCFLVFPFRVCRLVLTFLISHPQHATLPILFKVFFFNVICSTAFPFFFVQYGSHHCWVDLQGKHTCRFLFFVLSVFVAA